MSSVLPRLLLPAAITLLGSGCATQSVDQRAAETTGKLSCGGFFIYEMCVEDALGDHQADYLYFSDTNEIFMYREEVDLSIAGSLTMHRCAMPFQEDTLEFSSQLLYGEDMNLLEEMDVKRKLLMNFMAAKSEVDECYGGDSLGANAEATEAADDFVSDEYDWGED